ncbi:MAG: ParA family protein [Limnobacter sp.]|nr:ParA family protein [Limnobacter sp.]
MKVILVSSRKGGCGKSTISANLACYFSNRGLKVALMDLDPQQTLKFWRSERVAEFPILIDCAPDDWLIQSSELEEDHFDLLVIDSPPLDKKWIKNLMRQVELVVIPTRASPLDVYSATFSNEWAKKSGSTTRWVINAAHPNSRMPGDIKTSLQSIAKVFDTVIHQRTDISLSMAEGMSLEEFAPNSKSSVEFSELGAEVRSLLKIKCKK